jgi:hypothetical protein
MVAGREGHLNVIQVLIAYGADMNLQDKVNYRNLLKTAATFVPVVDLTNIYVQLVCLD